MRVFYPRRFSCVNVFRCYKKKNKREIHTIDIVKPLEGEIVVVIIICCCIGLFSQYIFVHYFSVLNKCIEVFVAKTIYHKENWANTYQAVADTGKIRTLIPSIIFFLMIFVAIVGVMWDRILLVLNTKIDTPCKAALIHSHSVN